MNPLNIVAFFDGTVGHEKQTNAILNALAKKTSIKVENEKISLHKHSVKDWMRYIYEFVAPKKLDKRKIDLIIGTGTHTHIPMLCLKNQCGARAITCMTPNFLLMKQFDICFVPWHDGLKSGSNIFTTIGPPCCAVSAGNRNIKNGLILIGGIDNKSHKWNCADIINCVKIIVEKETFKNWTISSSPRTPKSTVKQLEDFASKMSNVNFFKAGDTPSRWIEKQYAENHAVWITADSISMIYEGLTAGCNIGILPVLWKKKNSKFQKSENYLFENNLAISYEMWLNGKTITNKKPLNEAVMCAEEILKKWWQIRLQ